MDLTFDYTWLTSQGSTTIASGRKAWEHQQDRLTDFEPFEPLSSFSSSRRSSANGGGGGIPVVVEVHNPDDLQQLPTADINNNQQPDCTLQSGQTSYLEPPTPATVAYADDYVVDPGQQLDTSTTTNSTVYHGYDFSVLHPSLFNAG